MSRNLDSETVQGFGEEWSRFDQTKLDEGELNGLFESYFSIFPWDDLPQNAIGFDLGCGSGRWASKVAERVGHLYCIDASDEALSVAQRRLVGFSNVEFHHASVDEIPLPVGSMDFGYSLGVLHHIPDTQSGINSCVEKLKPGAPFLLYLYYAFDNRPNWFRVLWSVSDKFRHTISTLPFSAKKIATDLIAATVYFPLARLAYVASKFGTDTSSFPLAAYKDQSFYTMRTDSLDRFGTRVEQRFTRQQIKQMMETAGLEHVQFRDGLPYWCSVGIKTSND